MLAHLEPVSINPDNAIVKLSKATPSLYDPVQDKSVKAIVGEILSSKISQKIDQDDAFYVCDIGAVTKQHLLWKSLLPRIEPFFAIKSNPDPTILQLLVSLGIGFDCASKNEIQQMLDLGADPSRIIYANPCKQASYIQYAEKHNISKMTFDNVEELYKIKKNYPNAELLLRILADDSKALVQLGRKFGAPLDTVQHLLKTAKQLELNVVGVSFHVGSGCLDEFAFVETLQRARWTFDQGEKAGFNFTLLDVGGGFPCNDVTEGVTFEKIASVLGPAVDDLFPPEVRIISEPGRFYVSSALTLCVNIIGRRTVANDSGKPQYMYYLNEGVYTSFSGITYNRHSPQHRILFTNNRFVFGEDLVEEEYESSTWGPTCDSEDCLEKSIKLPLLEPGDWFYFENMGAYTNCINCRFNGFEGAKVFYTNTFN
ncbi:hypothetical protein K501DRAFT_191752 [Backusella circina FSU 941]|nr:hypothetical protein K501DRAFT_191752 [Backusella circina FSU 941]